jgi:hypothetical protein
MSTPIAAEQPERVGLMKGSRLVWVGQFWSGDSKTEEGRVRAMKDHARRVGRQLPRGLTYVPDVPAGKWGSFQALPA